MNVCALPPHWTEAGVSLYRLCRQPAEGRIVEVEQFGPVELALYEDEYRQTWRVLEPQDPVPMDRVEITRGEGPHHCCGKTQVYRHKQHEPCRIFDHAWTANPAAVASSAITFGRFPWCDRPESGYDKCDFEVYWTDGSEYGGRFDMGADGHDDGYHFRDSLRHRVLFYSGLGSTPRVFRSKNGIENYPDRTARERYHDYINRQPAFRDHCRHILGLCEL